MPESGLSTRAVRAVAWSGVSSVVLRLGGVVVGIVLARILTPEQFGVYAVALAVQGILMTIADLGLSADIIRSDQPERVAPTVGTLGLVSGTGLAVLMASTSSGTAEILGSPDAAPALAILSATLFLAGFSVVPYGLLQRRFAQRELFLIAVCDFVVSTAVTLALVAGGLGVLGLAIGRVAAQALTSSLQFLIARVRPRFAVDRTVVGSVLAYALPIAGANLVGWAMLNVDKLILARVVGSTGLGFYVLAFNVSNWPMNAMAQMVRSVSLPYFARSTGGLPSVAALAWAAALPAGAVLAVLAGPLIETLYGPRWLPAAPVLAGLGLYGGLRVVFDAFAGYLYARDRTRPVLWLQLISIAALTGGLLLVVPSGGIVAAAWLQVGIAGLVVLPGYLLSLRRAGVRPQELLGALWLPTLGAVPAVTVAVAAATFLRDPLVAMLAGGISAVAVHLLVMGTWLRNRLRALRATDDRLEEMLV
ncbi:oligosaccharide flippase family protein [Georgenia deserti]|uniref:Oligosaccharide flippase family protein n=1 Tax=Georgenia deserti TaxID=2093781 RepID=A0ABW4L8J1_9MICO